MNNISTYILQCPHCGAIKKVAFSTTPWSSSVVTYWSDGRSESDEWCEPAYTQQCQSCGHFFTLPPRNTLQIENAHCDDTGMLPYQTLKLAITELAGDEIAEARARLEAWWAYNKQYKDAKECDIPKEEKDFNCANMQWLLACYSKQTTGFSYVIFELHRLLGNLDICSHMIDELTFEAYITAKEQRYKKRGLDFQHNDDVELFLYNTKIAELNETLTQPLKPYIRE